MATWVAGELRRAEPPEGVTKQAWAARARKVEAEEPLARAVAVLAREWWAGNEELVELLE